MNSVPSPRDLQRYFTPQYCTKWRAIGAHLGLPGYSLDEIEANNQHSVRNCCYAMLSKWLESDEEASWKKLFHAIELLLVSTVSDNKGDKT